MVKFHFIGNKIFLEMKFFFLVFRYRLPRNVISTPGAVLHLSVWDADLVNDDFIGECFIPLTTLQPLRNFASLRDVPVSEMPLRRPHKNSQPRVFEVKHYSIRFCRFHFCNLNS